VREAENSRDARKVNGIFLKISDIDDRATWGLGSALGLEGNGEGGDLRERARRAEVCLR